MERCGAAELSSPQAGARGHRDHVASAASPKHEGPLPWRVVTAALKQYGRNGAAKDQRIAVLTPQCNRIHIAGVNRFLSRQIDLFTWRAFILAY